MKLFVRSLSDFVSSMANVTVIQGQKFATFDEGVSHVEQFCKAGRDVSRVPKKLPDPG